MFGISQGVEEPTPGDLNLVYGKDVSFLVIAGKNQRIFWFVFKKMDQKYHVPNIPRFSKEDAERQANDQLHRKITALLIILVFITGCAPDPPPIVDVPASDLDVKVTILDSVPEYQDVYINVQFFLNGKPVQFGDKAKVYSGDILNPMKFNPLLGYEERVKRQRAGSPYGIR